MSWWKELWCDHVYKEISKEYLRKDRIGNTVGFGIESYSTYNIYAHEFKCIKCNKIHIEEKRYLVI